MSPRIDDASATNFLAWLLSQVVADARGDHMQRISVAPRGRFWLGRLASEQSVLTSHLGERGERLAPCAVGVRVRPTELDGRQLTCRGRVVAWSAIEETEGEERAIDDDRWQKSEPIEVITTLLMPSNVGDMTSGGRPEFVHAFAGIGADGLQCEFHAEIESGKEGPELVVTLVNISPEELPGWETVLYEVQLEVEVGPTLPFTLENLPGSFRYDRRVAAYGVNSGVDSRSPNLFRTRDLAVHDQARPDYWDEELAGPKPDLTFDALANDPLPPLRELMTALDAWGDRAWSDETLRRRADDESWDSDMRSEAEAAAQEFRDEVDRIRRGVELLEDDAQLRRALSLANSAFNNSPLVKHTEWRPFQLGYLLANLKALSDPDQEQGWVDTVWFATGGGKTETYLLMLLTAAFYDRLRGKRQGITSWGRFPLRMLSLQQTQRFADVLAAAELVRREERIDGDPFSLGFFVGQNGTPNGIEAEGRPGRPGATDPDMPARYQVLLHCPFCGSDELTMRFDTSRWSLDHVCGAEGCPWGGRHLPFHVVDEEIYRFLPTVVLGTLDKAASIAMQAAMRGFYAPPLGRCARHGFTYAPRRRTPNGCLFPGCREQILPLDQEEALYPPTIRMQDELHLLRDSLGAVDSHYEALLDTLQATRSDGAKVIASSATLAGHDHQVRSLYRRQGRTFPLPGARAGHSFWSRESDRLARRFVGLAPRGVTIEYATDQLCESLQKAIRRAVDEPIRVAAEADVDEASIPDLVSVYGVDVVYGSNLKDVEAAARSFESQLPLDRLNPATLTGRTPLEEVRTTLERLTSPEDDYYDRIHLVAASSMLSHGVDIDRLNVMLMLGLPLATAEFIQTSSRIGRTHPGLVLVLHKIARERDAAVYRTFPAFVAHADRLLDAVPITSKSRRVLELTFSGLLQGRIYGIHEPTALAAGLRQLTTPASVRRAFSRLPILEDEEFDALVEMLAFTEPLDENLRRDLRSYLREFYRALNDPASTAQWVSDLFATGEPMLSLRDVEEQAPVYERGGRS